MFLVFGQFSVFLVFSRNKPQSSFSLTYAHTEALLSFLDVKSICSKSEIETKSYILGDILTNFVQNMVKSE